MTLQDLVRYHLLPYIGVTSLEPDDNANSLNRPGLSAYDTEMAASAVTAAVQEIFALGPPALSEQRRSAALRAPANIGFTATQYGTTISGITGFQSWMLGCTIRPSGDGWDNELTSQTSLLNPFMGPSGTVTATVYSDAVLLHPDEKNVIDPLEVPNVRPLTPAGSREEFLRMMDLHGRPGDIPPPILGGAYYNTQKSVGDPRWYLVEAQADITQSVLPIYIRLNPMPNRDLPLKYRVLIKPPVVTAAQVASGDDLPIVVIPVEWQQSILIPFARKRFMAHPGFSTIPTVRQQVMDDYATAKAELETFTPQVPSARAIYR